MATAGEYHEVGKPRVLKTCPDEIDHVFKILLIGNSGVGKSGLLLRFSESIFKEAYNTTIGVDFKFRTIEIDGKVVKLQIWDTSGQERFRAITANYYRNIHGIMIVYDMTNQNSFNQVDIWLDEIERNTTDDVSKILIGNKSDLKRKVIVDSDTARNFAEYLQIPFLETSVKTNTNVDEAFTTLAQDIMDRLSCQESVQTIESSIKLTSNSDDSTKRRKGCCVKKEKEV